MWSLSVEFQFYFAYALLILSLMLVRLRLRAVVLVLAVSAYFTCLAVRLTGYKIAPWPFAYLTMWSFDYLFLGVIAAAGLRPLISADKLRWGPIAAPSLLVGSQAVLVFSPAFGPGSADVSVLHRLAVPLAGCCFLALVLLASVNRAFVGRESMVYRFLVWIGELSYSIYLFHFSVFALFWLIAELIFPRLFFLVFPGFMQMAFSVPVIFFIAAVVYRYVEAPMNRYGARLAAAGGMVAKAA